MAAVPAPPNEAPAKPEQQESVAETPVTPSPAEGDGEAAADETKLELIKDLFKGATVAELKAALDVVPTEIRSELESEIERRGEQRVRTREKEIDEGQTARTAAFQAIASDAQKAQFALQQRVKAAKQGDAFALSDPDTLASEIDAYRNGAIASVALENEALMAPVRRQFLPDPTPEEKAKLEKALYEDGRRGTFTQVPVVVELAIARARAEGHAAGLKEGADSKAAKESLAAKLAKITEVKQQSPGVPINGKPASSEGARAALMRDMKSIDVTTAEGYAEWQKREAEFKKAVLNR